MNALLTENRLVNTKKENAIKVKNIMPSIALSIPFQPSMQHKRIIQKQLRNAKENVEMTLKGSYDQVCINNVLERLQKLFSMLNYNSHRKSVSLFLTPDEEKIIYLNYHVKPMTYINEQASLLNFTTNADRQPEFYFLFLRENNATLYEYYQNKLRRVFIKNQVPGLERKTLPVDLFKRVSQTIKLLNNKDEKPVFVTGSPNVVEQFCNSQYYTNIFFTMLYEVAPFSEELRKLLVNEICSHWDYWYSKFIIGRIKIAQKTNCLISNVELVLKALRKSADGWLLLDKNFKQSLHKSSLMNAFYNKSDELMYQIERFLSRGNRVEIAEIELLKNFGNIVLLQNNPMHFTVLHPISKPVYTRDLLLNNKS